MALGAARSLNIPFVTTYHGSYAGRSSVKVLYNSVMSRGDLVIANSHYTGDLIRSLYPQAADRVRVIHRGTDFSVFSPAAVSPERVENLRKSWNVAPHERVVLLAARLTGWKGQKVLVEAAAKLRDAGISDVAYILAGDPQGRDSYVKDLDALIEARKLKGIVRRVGHCTDMPAAFLAAAVVTVPRPSRRRSAGRRWRLRPWARPSWSPISAPCLRLSWPHPWCPPRNEPGGAFRPATRMRWQTRIGGALALGASARIALGARAKRHVERTSRWSAWSAARWRSIPPCWMAAFPHAEQVDFARFCAKCRIIRGTGRNRRERLVRPACSGAAAQQEIRAIRRPMRAMPVPQKDGPRANRDIRGVRDVQLIDDTGQNRGVMPFFDAMRIAEDAGLDLVEISPNATPPVCKILDYGKYRFLEQKKASEARKKQKTVEVKEIKLRPGIDDHDYDVKMKAMRGFFEEGNKVKVTLRFRGREMAHQDLGLKVLDRVKAE